MDLSLATRGSLIKIKKHMTYTIYLDGKGIAKIKETSLKTIEHMFKAKVDRVNRSVIGSDIQRAIFLKTL